jgi:predicted nuclease with TOPRIM domain
MAEIKDLLTDELDKLKNLSQRYNTIVKELGEKDLEIFELEDKLKKIKEEKAYLLEDYVKLRDFNKNLTSELIERYGEGRINLETGKIELF